MKNILHIIVLLTLLILSACDRNRNEQTIQFNQSLFLKEKTIPVITFKLNNDKINLILDTGSELNILNEDYYKSHSEKFILVDSVNNPINTINGIVLQKTYIVETVLNDSINVRFNVVDITDMIDNIFYSQQMMTDGLLGIDFFYDNNVVIDFKNKKLSR